MRPNGYWPDGNIKKIFDATTSQQIATYEYDAQGQLLSESTPSGTCDYTYDTVGNLLTVQSGSNIVTYTYGDLQWRDRLTRIEFNDREYAISYSGGNPLNWYNGSLYTNLTWGKDRQLVSLKKGTSTYSYSYDMDGIRKSKTVSGVTHNYLTQNGKVVQESYGTKVLQFVYDTAGAPYALRYSTDSGGSWYTFYYILNLQGDVVKLIYANGMACATYSYNAWGECSATTLSTSPVANIANINPLRYRGYYFDSETGFYYLQSRYYDPVVKRFINADSFASTGQGFLGYNMFAYCGNNPISHADITGHAFSATADDDGDGIPDYLMIRWRILTLTCAYQMNANCYAFAFKLENDPRTGAPFQLPPNPGEFFGTTACSSALNNASLSASIGDKINKEIVASAIFSAANLDGQKLGFKLSEANSASEPTEDGQWVVALGLYVSEDGRECDYHWWRRMEDGCWFHKPGNASVMGYDYSGNIIYDPQLCDCGKYNIFLGYYLVTPITLVD